MKLKEISPKYGIAEIHRFKHKNPTGEELDLIKEHAKTMKWERAVALYGDDEVLDCAVLEDAQCMGIVIFKPVIHKQSKVLS